MNACAACSSRPYACWGPWRTCHCAARTSMRYLWPCSCGAGRERHPIAAQQRRWLLATPAGVRSAVGAAAAPRWSLPRGADSVCAAGRALASAGQLTANCRICLRAAALISVLRRARRGYNTLALQGLARLRATPGVSVQRMGRHESATHRETLLQGTTGSCGAGDAIHTQFTHVTLQPRGAPRARAAAAGRATGGAPQAAHGHPATARAPRNAGR